MSLVAERVRSVGVASGAARLRRSSEVFVELFLFIFFTRRLFSWTDEALAIGHRTDLFPLRANEKRLVLSKEEIEK